MESVDWGSSLSWTRRLEYVLSDRPALDAFREWLTNNSNPEPLELHFAIRAYEKMAREGHARSSELARSIHQKYTSLRNGSCTFIPFKMRQEISVRVKSLGSSADPLLFTAIQAPLEAFLRRQHEQFVESDEFIDAFNKFSVGDNGFSTRKTKKGHVSQLTAETLLRSRHDRQHTLGESALERMYPVSSTRQPYTCRATTSENDSAVSSSFSSDANSHNNRPARLRSIREEHLRGNPTTYAIPRVETRGENQQFDHSTEEGRRCFANALTKKLNREQTRRRRNDETERQLRDIEDRKCTARDLISNSDEVETIDEDDDLDRYVERMREDSLKASAQRSPRISTLSPRHDSPERERSKSGHGFMSMSSYARSNQFAPPPANNSFNTSSYYKDRSSMYDSSGIESMAPSGLSDHSRHYRRIHSSSTTPRKPKKSQQSLVTISYKGPDGVPVVAHVPTLNAMITLKEFRRHFSISSKANVQFFFKTECDDDSAPYQLLLINDDSAILPFFEGRISAELKHCSS